MNTSGLSKSKIRSWLSVARRAVAAGERIALQSFSYERTNGYSLKSPGQIVTKADLTTNVAVQRVLNRLTPEIPVVSEEGGTLDERDASRVPLCWALDPIDGTTNFTARIPLWGISLALLSHGEPIVGAITLPSLGHYYFATRGSGAWMKLQREKTTFRLHVSRTSNPRDAIALLCHGGKLKDIRKGLSTISALGTQVRSERVLGAAVIEALWVAAGRVDFSILQGVHVWDVAAGALMVREAGGKVVTYKGEPWSCDDDEIVFSNAKILPAILKII